MWFGVVLLVILFLWAFSGGKRKTPPLSPLRNSPPVPPPSAPLPGPPAAPSVPPRLPGENVTLPNSDSWR